MDDERQSAQKLVGFRITRVVIDAYGIQVFGRKRGNEKLIAQSKSSEPCLFDGDGNLFAEIAG